MYTQPRHILEERKFLAEHTNLYERAVYYDIALNRDVSREIAFTQAAHQRYAGNDLTSLLDIACGPGYYAIEAAKRGIAAVGLDLIDTMLQLARERAAAAGVNVEWLQGDMRDFDLKAPVDMAITMFDGIDALASNDGLMKHFGTVARNLKPGGLYMIDYTHPRECSLGDYGSFHYEGERDGIKVEILWGTNDPVFDLTTGVATVDVELRVNDNGKEIVIQDSATERLYTPQEITLLAEKSGVFEVIAWHGAFDLNQPLDNTPQSDRMLAIMRKTDS